MVRLNIDLGELPDEAERLYALATDVNIACGGHAGDARSMRAACRLAKLHGARLFAHPGYADRLYFGRLSPDLIDVVALSTELRRQLDRLSEIAASEGVGIVGLKPHGALYHDVCKHPALGEALVELTRSVCHDALLVGPPRSLIEVLATTAGVRFAREGFADRTYEPDGSLRRRTLAGALIDDPAIAAEQALRLVRAGEIETLCVHGDGPHAVEIARSVRQLLERERLLE